MPAAFMSWSHFRASATPVVAVAAHLPSSSRILPPNDAVEAPQVVGAAAVGAVDPAELARRSAFQSSVVAGAAWSGALVVEELDGLHRLGDLVQLAVDRVDAVIATSDVLYGAAFSVSRGR